MQPTGWFVTLVAIACAARAAAAPLAPVAPALTLAADARLLDRILSWRQRMQCVPEHVVERTWDSVTQMGLSETRALMRKAGPFQDELVGFAIGFGHELSPDGGALVMYMTVLVLEMFRELGEEHVRCVGEDAIMAHLRRNEASLDDTPGVPDTLPGMVAALGPMQERFVMHCVIETLARATEGDDSFDLTTAEICHVFLVLKTVVDCLHDSCSWGDIETTACT